MFVFGWLYRFILCMFVFQVLFGLPIGHGRRRPAENRHQVRQHPSPFITRSNGIDTVAPGGSGFFTVMQHIHMLLTCAQARRLGRRSSHPNRVIATQHLIYTIFIHLSLPRFHAVSRQHNASRTIRGQCGLPLLTSQPHTDLQC